MRWLLALALYFAILTGWKTIASFLRKSSGSQPADGVSSRIKTPPKQEKSSSIDKDDIIDVDYKEVDEEEETTE